MKYICVKNYPYKDRFILKKGKIYESMSESSPRLVRMEEDYVMDVTDPEYLVPYVSKEYKVSNKLLKQML